MASAAVVGEEPRRVSVVLIARNMEALLPHQLEALAGQTYQGDWEVVLVDNGSTDRTVDVARGWADRIPRLRVIEAAGARGANHALNAGADVASGDLLLFCAADDVADSGWVAAMARAARVYDAVGGYLEEDLLNSPLVRSWRLPSTPGCLPSKVFLPYPVGANSGVHTAVFRELGGFNPAYVNSAEEVEFFWRVQLAGYSLGYVPAAIVHYRHHSDLLAMMRQHYRYGSSSVQLYRDFRPRGREHATFHEVVRAWAPLVTGVPYLGSAARRGDWLRTLAVRAGQIRGSIAHRRFFIS